MDSEDAFAVIYAQQTERYTCRVPSPPRILIPPRTSYADSDTHMTLLAANDNPQLAFLREVHIDYRHPTEDWTYERRRQAQSILPFLSLGPMNAARDDAYLCRENITMVLGVRHATVTTMPTAMPPRTIDLPHHPATTVERCALSIASNQDLIHAFPSVTAAINQHLAHMHRASDGARAGKVLVFCESGNERSAAVAAAYVMEMYADVDHVRAIQLCQSRRFCVNFDDGLKRLLQSYWDILQAKRAVEGAAGMSGGGAGRIKRAREQEVDDDWMEIVEGDSDDPERRGGRQFSPFVDQMF